MLHKTILGGWVEDPLRLALTGPLASAKTTVTAPPPSCCFLPSNQLGPVKSHLQTAQKRGADRKTQEGCVCVCVCVCLYSYMWWPGRG